MSVTSMQAVAMPRRSSPASPVWFGGNMPVARFGLIVSLLVPLSLLIWDANHHMLGVNAVNFAIHTTGGIAVICILLSLAVTPLKNVTGFTWVIQFRRSLGCYAFYYALAHLLIYFWWDRQRSLSSTVYEITHRYYLAIGFASLALMTPLWATSFNLAIQKMGGVWWKRLHRLTYLAAALACYHFYLQTKADKRLPDVALASLGVLMLWRGTSAVIGGIRKSKKSTVPVSAAKSRFWKGDLKVVGRFQETPMVSTFRLAPADGGSIPFSFSAGQFMNIMVDIDAKRVGRSYTIASPPTRDAYVELTIKREEGGQVSTFLHDMLITGKTISVSAPAGRFTFDPLSRGREEPGVLLLAGGVGITPVMSILRDLTDRCWPGKIDLIFSARTVSDIIFADELRLLASRHRNLKVHLTITRDIPPSWSGHRGRITAQMVQQLVPDFTNRPVFICGPDAMAQATRDELIGAGVAPDRITVESFTPAVAKTPGIDADLSKNATSTATLAFSISGKTAPIDATQSVLEAAEAIGVPIDNQCRSGVCGTCRVKMLSGHVTMEVRDALSDADEADGFILACQAHATEDLTIDA